MTQKTEYDAGTACWIDLGTPDIDAAVAFYGDVFGWAAEAAGPVEETGGYRMMTKAGAPVAGIGPFADASQPTAWTPYFSVADADKAAAIVSESGGTVTVPPMDVMGLGRMVQFTDAAGAWTALWQPIMHIGSGLVDEPGALCWVELITGDTDAAARFYADLFGWTAEATAVDGQPYTVFKLGEPMVAGMMTVADAPPHWLINVAVDDCDAAVSRCTSGGGAVMIPAVDFEYGRSAVLTDPFGAAFGILGPSAQQPA